MSRSFEIGKVNVNLTPRPINPSWITEGNPEASSCLLSESADGLAWTIVWHCTEGKFDWHYDFDETIMILEGSVVLEIDGTPAKRYGPGDVVFFKDGAHAKWHVEGSIKKLAFCRRTPLWLSVALRVLNWVRNTGDQRGGLGLLGGDVVPSPSQRGTILKA